MSEIFVPSFYYKTLRDKNIYNYNDSNIVIKNIVVGLFENKEDAIKALFKKLIKENCFIGVLILTMTRN